MLVVDDAADYVLGVDAGGTATTAVLARRDGRIVATGVGGPANVRAVGEEVAYASFDAAVGAALGCAAGVTRERVVAVAVGLAGTHLAADGERFAALLQPLLPQSRITVYNDGTVALTAATRGQAGVVVVAGTGSICVGADQAGREARCGGWGHVFGDEGSAYAIACNALRAASRAADGRAPATMLVPAVVETLGLPAFDGIIDRVYGPPPMTRTALAALAPMVLRCAMAGDAAAREILAAAGEELATMATTVAQRLGLGPAPFPVACSGSTWNAGPLLLDPFTRRVRVAYPAARIGPPSLTPAAGAVLLALRALDGAMPPLSVVESLRATGGAYKPPRVQEEP